MKKDEIMERKVDENLKKALKDSEYWRYCYKHSPNKEFERYLIVFHNTSLYDIEEKELNKYVSDMATEEDLKMQKDIDTNLKYLKYYYTIAPSQMAKSLTKARIEKLEKLKGGK